MCGSHTKQYIADLPNLSKGGGIHPPDLAL